MSSDGGDGPLKQLERSVNDQIDKFKRDPFGQIVKHATNFVTAGTLKYDPDSGKMGYGSTIRNMDETIGEISGRNRGRAELQRAEENIRKAEAAALKDRSDREYQAMIADRMASMEALGAQRPVRGERSIFSRLGSDEDFLGL